MINAGRVLIIPKGEWTNLESYEMLDLVTRGDIAYIARQASVGVDPATDTQLTYWQPFGTAAKIATTTTPGLVMPDGTTVTIDATGLISANIGISDINNVTITSISNGQILQYNSSTQRWENKSLGSAASRNATSSITSGSTDLIESGAVNSLKQTLESDIDDLTASVSTKADQSLLAPIQTTLVASKAYAIGEQFVYQGLLYKVTTAIAQGGTITINGNCELSSDLCDQIKQLDSSLHPNYNLISQQLVVEDSTASQSSPKTHTLTVNASGLAFFTLRSRTNYQNNLYINDATLQSNHRIGLSIDGAYAIGNIPVNAGDVLYLLVQTSNRCEIYIYS